MLRTLVQRCVVSVPRSHTCTTSRHLLQRVASSAPLPTRSSSSTTSTSTTSGRIDDAAVAVNRLDALREQASSSKQALASIYRLPSSFRPTHSITRYVREFEHAVAPGQRLLESPVTLAGRITKRRDASKKLIFYDLESGGTKVQIMADRATASDPHEFDLLHQQLQRGDIVGVTGVPAKTKLGELSIVPSSMWLLSPCMRPIPHFHGLRDVELRYRQRYLDLIANQQTHHTFHVRHKIISFIRSFLDRLDFVEVETPILSPHVGGAIAEPFTTHLRSLVPVESDKEKPVGMTLHMRIAPELYLKQLIIGGMERVYEIGKQFRNEGMDATHNPEFTTCEFYQAYTDYEQLMTLTETMLFEMVSSITGSPKVKLPHADGTSAIEIDFTPPFRRISVLEELEKQMQVGPLPDANDPEQLERWLQLCDRFHVPLTERTSLAYVIDKLVGRFVEKHCIQPTFLINHPLSMSPLAKPHSCIRGVTERFELFIGTKEYVNAYTELNEPELQRKQFSLQTRSPLQQQQQQHQSEEQANANEEFCFALEYGMPPTGGWGLGIDRLAMLLSGAQHIREVLFFPLLRPRKLSDYAFVGATAQPPRPAAPTNDTSDTNATNTSK